MTRVSNEDKIKFINWLISNYNFKAFNSETKQMLTYIKESIMINRVEFVSGKSKYFHTLLLAAFGAKDENHTFRFITDNGGATNFVEAAFTYIKKNIEHDTDEYLEIVIDFNGINAPEYQAVIDGGPNQEVEEFLAEVQKDIEIKKIKADIDASLSEMNKDKFMELTSKLKQIIG